MCLIKLFKKKKQPQQQEEEAVKNLYTVEYVNVRFIKNQKDIDESKVFTIGVAATNTEEAKRTLATRVFLANEADDILKDKDGFIIGCTSQTTEENCGIRIREKYRFLRVRIVKENNYGVPTLYWLSGNPYDWELLPERK